MLYNLYQYTETHEWHDITRNAFAEEGDELLPESGKDTYVCYGYAFHPSYFSRWDGGTFSRKDSSFTETYDVKRISSLPPGAELSRGLTKSWSDIRRQIIYHIPILQLAFAPRFYLKYNVWFKLRNQYRNRIVWPLKRIWS